jgi:hypothetical protein
VSVSFAASGPGYGNHMSDQNGGVWRDEERLPLRDLERAMGASAADGEVDDTTGNDAGAESAFGHGAESATRDEGATDPERAYRPSTTGRTGPH